MLQFKSWFEAQVPEKAIALPKTRQVHDGACGANAFKVICRHFNIGPDEEKKYMDILHSTKEGTWPENIVKHAKEFGFKVHSKVGWNIKELTRFLDRKIPVICAMQAWGDPKTYKKEESGHYVVAIGYDKDKIFFEDGKIKSNSRGYLTHAEFDKRWHDVDAHGHDCDHLGIAMWLDKAPEKKKIASAKHID